MSHAFMVFLGRQVEETFGQVFEGNPLKWREIVARQIRQHLPAQPKVGDCITCELPLVLFTLKAGAKIGEIAGRPVVEVKIDAVFDVPFADVVFVKMESGEEAAKTESPIDERPVNVVETVSLRVAGSR